MPVQGCCKSLEIQLDALFANDSLKSWQIYEEKNGCVTVKLRFNGHHIGQNGLNIATGGEVKYRRKSEQQVVRDRKRAESFKNSHGVVTRSRSRVSECPSAEKPRNCNSFHSTPVLPTDLLDVTQQCSDLNPLAPDFNLNDPNSPDNVLVSPGSHASPEPPINNTTVDPEHHKSPITVDCKQSLEMNDTTISACDIKSASESNSDSDCEDDVLPDGCYNSLCAYGGGGNGNYMDIYRCTKCKVFYVCSKCKREGGHQKHSRYIEMYEQANIK